MVQTFQYISCYSLSSKGTMLLLRVQSFNTSHVTLYPVPEMIYLPRDSFNTSYVTLYLQNKTHLEHQSFSFNTSHITLYRRNWKRRKKVTAVSIHLMLLFIYSILRMVQTFWFVSIHLMLLFIGKSVFVKTQEEYCFNTSHVTLYRIEYHETYGRT